MRVFASVLLAVASAFAYQVTYPGGSQGWNTTGPNYLMWERVDTDPLSFAGVLTNVNSTSNQVMDAVVDGTLGTVACSPPSGGWPSGTGFRVNLAQDAQNLDVILAQSSEFDITADSSSASTTSSASIQTSTTSSPTVTSSDTSTTPTGVSAASLGADTQAGLLTVVAALTAFITALF